MKVLNDYEMNKKVAQNIIEAINSGNVQSWRKFWSLPKGETSLYDMVIEGMAAALVFSKKMLPSEQMIPAGFYATFKELKANGLHLLKGAKSEQLYKRCSFYKELTENQQKAFDDLLASSEELAEEYENFLQRKQYYFHASFSYLDTKGIERDFDEDLEIKKGKVVYKRFQWVAEYIFNIKDVKETVDVKTLWNIQDKKDTERKEVEVISNVEAIKESYIQRSALKYEEVFQGRAFYRPSNHSVTLPTKAQFKVPNEYYQVMFHEFAHSTGAHQLLNRASLTGNMGFGSTSYSKEELVAELSSLYTLSSLEILTDEIVANSVSYIQGWGSNFGRSIEHNIINTIEHSRKATDLILNIQRKAA